MSDLDKSANTEATHVDVEELLANIRNQFYTEATAKKFFQDRNVLLLAITYPAKWLKERGVTWSSDRRSPRPGPPRACHQAPRAEGSQER